MYNSQSQYFITTHYNNKYIIICLNLNTGEKIKILSTEDPLVFSETLAFWYSKGVVKTLKPCKQSLEKAKNDIENNENYSKKADRITEIIKFLGHVEIVDNMSLENLKVLQKFFTTTVLSLLEPREFLGNCLNHNTFFKTTSTSRILDNNGFRKFHDQILNDSDQKYGEIIGFLVEDIQSKTNKKVSSF